MEKTASNGRWEMKEGEEKEKNDRFHWVSSPEVFDNYRNDSTMPMQLLWKKSNLFKPFLTASNE